MVDASGGRRIERDGIVGELRGGIGDGGHDEGHGGWMGRKVIASPLCGGCHRAMLGYEVVVDVGEYGTDEEEARSEFCSVGFGSTRCCCRCAFATMDVIHAMYVC